MCIITCSFHFKIHFGMHGAITENSHRELSGYNFMSTEYYTIALQFNNCVEYTDSAMHIDTWVDKQ